MNKEIAPAAAARPCLRSDLEYEDEISIGYAVRAGNWNILLKQTATDEGAKVVESVWRFNSAPRDLRLEAVDAIPKLIDALSAAVQAKAEKVKVKAKQLEEYTTIVSAVNARRR